MRIPISFKVWMTTTTLVLVVLLLLGYMLESQFSGYYYRWQEAKMVREVKHLAMLAASGELHNNPQKLAHYEKMLGEQIILAEQSRELAGCLPFDYVAEEALISRDERARILNGEILVKREFSQRIGTEVFAVVAPVTDKDRMVGAVFLYSTTEEINKALNQFRQLYLYTAAAVLAIGSLSSILLANTLTIPVIRLRRNTEDLEKGEYEVPLEVKRQDEIGDLERSLENLRQTLRDKTAKVEQQEEVRREFVANVSHELRTPLSYIQGYLEALLDGMEKNPAEGKQYLRIIHEETLRLRRLVDDLLDLQALAAGRSSGPKEAVESAEWLVDVHERFLPVARDKLIRLVLDIREPLPSVWANRDRLEQILINLLGNSLRFTGEGGEIRLLARTFKEGLEVAVVDNGPGIPPENLERIWQRFYKGDESRQGGGSGLGLAIVKGIVEEHGGTIRAESTVGQGTTFTFWLPSLAESAE